MISYRNKKVFNKTIGREKYMTLRRQTKIYREKFY